jgi:protein SCO1/2
MNGTKTTISALAQQRNLVLHFFYTRCNGSCPVTTLNLKKVTRMMPGKFEKDAMILSISLDPERDTAGDLQAFASRNSLPHWWQVARCDRQALDSLLDTIGFNAEPYDAKTKRIVHTSEVVFGSQKTGRWRMANPQWSEPFVVKELFEITFDGVQYRNPRRPGVNLDRNRRSRA